MLVSLFTCVIGRPLGMNTHHYIHIYLQTFLFMLSVDAVFSGSLRLNEEFHPMLYDNSSQEFSRMKIRVENMVRNHVWNVLCVANSLF